MSAKTTPETDAAWQPGFNEVHRYMTSRRLELQLADARKERDQLKEVLLIMKNLLKPGIELFPEIGEILKRGTAK